MRWRLIRSDAKGLPAIRLARDGDNSWIEIVQVRRREEEVMSLRYNTEASADLRNWMTVEEQSRTDTRISEQWERIILRCTPASAREYGFYQVKVELSRGQ